MSSSRESYGRSSPRNTQRQERSKRQERVGQLVRVELAQIIQLGYPIKFVDPLEDDLRRKINVVNADVSPDLRQARITVSILGKGSEANAQKRKAYSWLVTSTKMIRHALAQRMSHLKNVPTLTFVLADVGAAVDVMSLIDRIANDKNYKRDTIAVFPEEGEEDEEYDEDGDDDAPSGVQFGLDFDEEGSDDGWIDEEDEDAEGEEVLLDDDEQYEFEDYEDEDDEGDLTFNEIKK